MENLLGLVILGFPMFIFTLIMALVLSSVAFSIWMFVDCLNREEKTFKDKTLWTVLLAVGFFSGHSLLFSIIYYFVVKKKLDN